jgi:Uma2 family endonuclease
MFAYDCYLPTAEELPDSDETPVDNDLQNDIPNLLLNSLRSIWAERQDWHFGVDMGIYHDPISRIPIVPDGFLALGVPRLKSENGRLSYVLWEENYILPKLVLEVVSQSYNGEYDTKMQTYQDLGILYYVIYNPLTGRRGAYKLRQPLEVYKLILGVYQKQSQLKAENYLVWLPEIGLGIGCDRGSLGSWEREWLYWYDAKGDRYPTPEEKNERLSAYLRSIGIDPDRI